MRALLPMSLLLLLGLGCAKQSEVTSGNRSSSLTPKSDCNSADDCYARGVVLISTLETRPDARLGRSLFQLACDDGHSLACTDLAGLLLRGIGGARDVGRAHKLLKQACDTGVAFACLGLGEIFLEGPELNPQQAAVFFQRACDGENQGACYNLGLLHLSGSGVPRDLKRAESLYSRACIHGVPGACIGLKTGIGLNQNELAKIIEKQSSRCEEEHWDACFANALAYAEGLGVEKDSDRAAKLYSKACDGGHGFSCFNLGASFAHGQSGQPQDYNRAATLHQQACDLGFAVSCSSLGLLAMQGNGVPQDFDRGRQLFERACEVGVAEACFHLGRVFGMGSGVTKDLDKARGLLEGACEKGYMVACSVHPIAADPKH